MIDVNWVVVFLVAPLYPVLISITYRQGKLKEEISWIREILMKYVRLNGFNKRR